MVLSDSAAFIAESKLQSVSILLGLSATYAACTAAEVCGVADCGPGKTIIPLSLQHVGDRVLIVAPAHGVSANSRRVHRWYGDHPS